MSQVERYRSTHPRDRILLATRRHWWAWLRWLPVPLALMLASFALAAALPPIAGVFVFAGVVFPLGLTLYLYAEWANDTMLITDTRLVRMTYTLLTFSESINEMALTSIQEVNAQVPAFDPFAYLFGYGTLEVRTSGETGNFRVTLIPNPDRVQRLIMEDLYVMRQQQARPDGGAQDSGQTLGVFTRPPLSPFVTSYTTADGAFVVRKHWSLWLSGVTLPLLLLLGALFTLIGGMVLEAAAIGFGVAFVLAVVGSAWFWWADWDWRNDTMTISDSTVTLVQQRPLWLQNERDQVLLRQIDNIVAESNGFFNRLLGKGNVRMALVGSNEYKEFRDVQDPLRVQGEITRRQARLKQQAAQQAANPPRVLSDHMTIYHHTPSAPRIQQPVPAAPPAMPQFRAGTPISNPPPRVARPALSQGRLYQPNAVPTNPPPARPASQPASDKAPSVIAPPPPNSTRPPRLQGKKL